MGSGKLFFFWDPFFVFGFLKFKQREGGGGVVVVI